MKRIDKTRRVLGLLIVGLFLASPATIAAQPVPPGIEQKETEDEGLHRGWSIGKHKGWDKQELNRLRKEEPEKFKELIKQRREELTRRLQKLKQKTPRDTGG